MGKVKEGEGEGRKKSKGVFRGRKKGGRDEMRKKRGEVQG